MQQLPTGHTYRSLLTFFGVERARDEVPQDIFPLGLAPFIRLRRGGPLEDTEGRIVPMGIAGIHASWRHPDGRELSTFAMRRSLLVALASAQAFVS